MNKIVIWFKSRNFLFLWLLAFMLNIIAFFFLAYKDSLHGANVALRDNVKAGVFWYGAEKNLYALPLLGLAFNALNYIIFRKLSLKETFLLPALIFTSILAQVLLLINLLFLVQVN